MWGCALPPQTGEDIAILPASWQHLCVRSGEPWFSQGLGWVGDASPGSSPSALLADRLWGCAGAFWLLGTSAMAMPRELVRLRLGMAAWVYAVVWRADGKPFVPAEDCLRGDTAYV